MAAQEALSVLEETDEVKDTARKEANNTKLTVVVDTAEIRLFHTELRVQNEFRDVVFTINLAC